MATRIPASTVARTCSRRPGASGRGGFLPEGRPVPVPVEPDPVEPVPAGPVPALPDPVGPGPLVSDVRSALEVGPGPDAAAPPAAASDAGGGWGLGSGGGSAPRGG